MDVSLRSTSMSACLSCLSVSLSICLSSIKTSLGKDFFFFLKERDYPWLVGVSAGLRTKGSPSSLSSQGTCLGCGPGSQ